MEQIVVISTSLVMNISELEKMVDSFNLDHPMSTITKMRWVRNEEEVNDLLARVRASRASLDLVLTIFTWWVL